MAGSETAGALCIVTVYQTDPLVAGQGGGVRYVRNLLNEQRRYCDEILFFGVGDEEKREGAIHLVPIARKLGHYIPFLGRLCLKIIFMDFSKYSVVHVHRLYFAIPFLVLKPKLNVICTQHGRSFTVFENRVGGRLFRIIAPLFRMIEKFALKRVHRFVPVSADVIRTFQIKYPELVASRSESTTIIGSMLDLQDFQVDQSDDLQRAYGTENKYLIFLGRLSAVKDVEFLLQLFSEKFQDEPNIKLVLVGSGEDAIKLKQRAKELCPTNEPIFHGEIPSTRVPSLLQSGSLLLLCSHHEASPTIIKEALASGLPVVTNAIGDVDEFVQAGKNGFIATKDIACYNTAIRRLLDTPLRREDVFEVSASSLAKCSRQYIGERYHDIYRDLQLGRAAQTVG